MAKRGPSTENGRKAIGKNAWKHGLTSDVVAIRDFEDVQQWEAVRDGIFRYYEPEGDLEYLLAERIAINLWKLRRLDNHQMTVTLAYMRQARRDLEIAGAYIQGTISKGEYPEVSDVDLDFEYGKRQIPDADRINLIIRYEAHLHRLYVQTMHELEALQERRRGGSSPLARVDITGAP